jgi:rhodanese-related sulfurtransferase
MYGSYPIKEIEAPELARWLEEKKGKFRIIDVRQLSEIAAGTVPGAEPLPLHLLPMRLHELPKDEPIVFVCRSGARSANACAFLQAQGFDNVYNLRGGMIAWAQTGQAVKLPEAV